MKVFFTHLGCKLNQAELEHLARRFLSQGHQLAGDLEDADLHVINSCTVTHVAARDSRKAARRAGRIGAGAHTVLTGCYATGSAAEANTLPGVDLVVANSEKDRLLELVHNRFPELSPEARSSTGDRVLVSYAPLEWGHTRAAIKIEDGCNMRCSFCIIPSTRGRQRSRNADEILTELRELVDLGYREVVVTGVQISCYRHRGLRLFELVERMLAESAIERLRLTSIAPWQFDRRLLELWPCERLCRHFHFSLQSGCDETLRRMRRPYSTRQYRDLVESVRAAIPGVAITTDVIVGFPGETEDEFQQSLELVGEMGLALTHVFPYSPRQGTAAAALPDSVDAATRKARVAEMRLIAQRSATAFRRQHLGSQQRILWEDYRRGAWTGMSDNYLRTFLSAADSDSDPAAGTISDATIVDVTEDGVWARRHRESTDRRLA